MAPPSGGSPATSTIFPCPGAIGSPGTNSKVSSKALTLPEMIEKPLSPNGVPSPSIVENRWRGLSVSGVSKSLKSA